MNTATISVLGLALLVGTACCSQCPVGEYSNDGIMKNYTYDPDTGNCYWVRKGFSQIEQVNRGCDDDEYMLNGLNTGDFGLSEIIRIAKLVGESLLWLNADLYTPPGETVPVGWVFNGGDRLLNLTYEAKKQHLACVEYKRKSTKKLLRGDCTLPCPIVCVKPKCFSTFIFDPVRNTCNRTTRPDLPNEPATGLCADNELIVRDLPSLDANAEAGGSTLYWIDAAPDFDNPVGNKILFKHRVNGVLTDFVINKAGNKIQYIEGVTEGRCLEYKYVRSSKSGNFNPRNCADGCPVLCVADANALPPVNTFDPLNFGNPNFQIDAINITALSTSDEATFGFIG